MHNNSGKHVSRWPAVCLALAMLAALFALAPSAAYAGWSHPPDTLTKAHNVQGTVVKIDAQGTSYAVWQDGHGPRTSIRFRVRPAGAVWGAAETVSTNAPPVLADAVVAPDGTLTILWFDTTRSSHNPTGTGVLHASTRAPHGAWTRSTVSGSDASMASAALDKHGDLIVAWTTTNGVQTRYRPAGRGWRPIETVLNSPPSTPSGNAPYASPEVGLDGAGAVSVAWIESDAARGTPTCEATCGIFTSTRSAHGTWSQPTNLTPTDTSTNEPYSLAVGSTGETVLAWSSWLAPFSTSVVVRPAGGTAWGAPQSLGAYDSVPTAVVGPDGSATVVFGRQTVHVWDHAAKGAWTESTFGRTYDAAQVTSAPNGAQLVTWAANAKDHAMTRKSGGTWSKAVEVAGYGSSAIDNDRHAVIGWDGKTTSYDPSTPRFASVTAPSRARALVRLAYAVTLTSWLPARVTWHFRDGRTAPGRAVHHIFKIPGTFRVKVTVTDTSGSKTTVTRPIHVAKAP